MKVSSGSEHDRHQARDDQHLDGRQSQGADGVDLLLHLHRADLGGEGGARAPGDDYRGEQRRQLAAHREADAVDDEDIGAVALRLHPEEIGEHHADEERDQRDDRDRVEPDRLELRHRFPQAEAPGATQEREELEHHHTEERVVGLEQASDVHRCRPEPLHQAQMRRAGRRRRRLHALVDEREQPPVPLVESARAHHRFGAADAGKMREQRKSRRGVELLQAAAVEDEALPHLEAQAAQRCGDRRHIGEAPGAGKVKDAGIVLHLLLDPRAGRIRALHGPQYAVKLPS
jgi:hypothetical protein